MPNDDETRHLEILLSDQSQSIDTSTSLECHPSFHKSDTFDSQTELGDLERDVVAVESPRHTRYSSPLFQQLLGQPIEPVKILRSPSNADGSVKIPSSPSIPEDISINNLLHTASLVSKTQKAPEILAVEIVEEKILTPTNNANNDELSEEAIDEQLLKQFSVTEKRPSVNDPEQVLMKNVVPGEIFLKL